MSDESGVKPIPEGYHTITPYLNVRVMPVTDHFYGDRSGVVADPFGHRWNLSTHIEDVPPEEMDRRMKEMMSG